MDKDKRLSYLKQFENTLVILSQDNITLDQRKGLSESWHEILLLGNNERITKVLELWLPFSEEFSQVLAYFRNNLLSIDLINSSRGISLLYGIKANGSDNVMYYEGRQPVSTIEEQDLASFWSKVPDKLQKFYSQLHNGWYYFASQSMGLSPLQNIFVLSKEHWGIIDQLSTVPVDLSQSIAIFSNGMGGYVCLELLKNKTHTFLWFHDEAPKTNLDLWPVVDTWILLGFEG